MPFLSAKNLIYIFILSVLWLVVIPACSHVQKKGELVSIEDIQGETLNLQKIDLTDKEKLNAFLKVTEKELFAVKKGEEIPKSVRDKIHHAQNLYSVLTQLKKTKGKISIPAKTHLALKVDSFCIDANQPLPDSKEVFQWVAGKPSLPLYSKILKHYAHSNKAKRNKKLTQELIWNLSNKTYYENYPEKLKKLLNEIDSEGPLKAHSMMKETALEVGSSILEEITGLDVRNAINIVQGQYYDFEQFRKNLENLRSSYPISHKTFFSKVPETNLLVTSRSNGYKSQTLNLYNSSNTPQTIELSQYYLQPSRKDVQRVALASVATDIEDYKQLLDKFFKNILGYLASQYFTLTKEEKALVRKDFLEAWKVYGHKNKAKKAEKQFFKDKGTIDGEGDAFRHFVWAGLLTNDLGQKRAETYLDAHESRGFPHAPDRKMDEHNNRKGIEAALRLKKQNRFSDKALYEEALKSIQRGELIILKPTGGIPQ